MKKIISLTVAATLLTLTLAGCANGGNSAGSATQSAGSAAQTTNFKTSHDISVISREEGSGTRGAFIELFGIQEKDFSGKKVDKTTQEATITAETSVMLTNVAGDEYAIGYISLGSMNNTVKALKVDGAEATAANIKAGTYKISRPFNIATKGDPTGLSKDFIEYIMSKEGQTVITDNGYIAASDSAASFAGSKPQGKITVSGSSSVTPVMQKIAEAYMKLNTGATVEVQQTDSSTGMKDVAAGNCDIGMASRELTDSEKSQLKSSVIAIDGVAVIVNPGNPLSNITSAQVKSIYTGNITTWDAVK